jgi:UPF0755 protein
MGCVVALLLAVALGFGSLYLAADQVKALGVGVILSVFDSPASTDSTDVVFTVAKGENTAQVASRLESQHLITNAEAFRLLARLRGLDQSLEAGDYHLRKSMRMGDILSTLQKATAQQNRLTVLEGWRALELADELEFRKVASKDDVMALVTSSAWTQPFIVGRPSGASLEGYLFPDTYQLDKETTARVLVGKMLDNFAQRVLPAWNSRRSSLKLTLHEVVTLAAIVEREAQAPAERPIIASVYLNRLAEGMLLQADPTVQYALVAGSSRPADGYWKKDLTLADLAYDSPYNTYKYPGLPPGPICNPGLASIQAVLQPAETDYYFFMAKGDGSHAFAKTLAEHNENVQRYRKQE